MQIKRAFLSYARASTHTALFIWFRERQHLDHIKCIWENQSVYQALFIKPHVLNRTRRTATSVIRWKGHKLLILLAKLYHSVFYCGWPLNITVWRNKKKKKIQITSNKSHNAALKAFFFMGTLEKIPPFNKTTTSETYWRSIQLFPWWAGLPHW